MHHLDFIGLTRYRPFLSVESGVDCSSDKLAANGEAVQWHDFVAHGGRSLTVYVSSRIEPRGHVYYRIMDRGVPSVSRHWTDERTVTPGDTGGYWRKTRLKKARALAVNASVPIQVGDVVEDDFEMQFSFEYEDYEFKGGPEPAGKGVLRVHVLAAAL